jgi:hypothetical protein
MPLPRCQRPWTSSGSLRRKRSGYATLELPTTFSLSHIYISLDCKLPTIISYNVPCSPKQWRATSVTSNWPPRLPALHLVLVCCASGMPSSKPEQFDHHFVVSISSWSGERSLPISVLASSDGCSSMVFSVQGKFFFDARISQGWELIKSQCSTFLQHSIPLGIRSSVAHANHHQPNHCSRG